VRRRTGGSREVAAGLEQLDGYLLRWAEQQEAEVHAETFVAGMPWLTTAQREEVIRLYVQDRIAYSTAALRRVAERCHDLRAEYSARYTHLRNCLLRVTTASLLGAATLWVLVVALAMGR
jgi:hypothetical protein